MAAILNVQWKYETSGPDDLMTQQLISTTKIIILIIVALVLWYCKLIVPEHSSLLALSSIIQDCSMIAPIHSALSKRHFALLATNKVILFHFDSVYKQEQPLL